MDTVVVVSILLTTFVSLFATVFGVYSLARLLWSEVESVWIGSGIRVVSAPGGAFLTFLGLYWLIPVIITFVSQPVAEPTAAGLPERLPERSPLVTSWFIVGMILSVVLCVAGIVAAFKLNRPGRSSEKVQVDKLFSISSTGGALGFVFAGIALFIVCGWVALSLQ